MVLLPAKNENYEEKATVDRLEKLVPFADISDNN